MAYGETCKMLLASQDVFRHVTPAVSGNRTQQHRWSLSVLCSHNLIKKIRTGYFNPSCVGLRLNFFFLHFVSHPLDYQMQTSNGMISVASVESQ